MAVRSAFQPREPFSFTDLSARALLFGAVAVSGGVWAMILAIL